MSITHLKNRLTLHAVTGTILKTLGKEEFTSYTITRPINYETNKKDKVLKNLQSAKYGAN